MTTGTIKKVISERGFGFISSTGSNTGAMTTTLFMDAITLLDVNNIPTSPRVCRV